MALSYGIWILIQIRPLGLCLSLVIMPRFQGAPPSPKTKTKRYANESKNIILRTEFGIQYRQ